MIATKQNIKAINLMGKEFVKQNFNKDVNIDFKPFTDFKGTGYPSGSGTGLTYDSTSEYDINKTLFYGFISIKYTDIISNVLYCNTYKDYDGGFGAQGILGAFKEEVVNSGGTQYSKNIINISNNFTSNYHFFNAYDYQLPNNLSTISGAECILDMTIEGFIATYR